MPSKTLQPWSLRVLRDSHTARQHAGISIRAVQDSRTRCPVGRLGQQRLSFQSYDPEPYTSIDYQGIRYRMGMGLQPMKMEVEPYISAPGRQHLK